jgi:chromosome segregation ATPase
MEKTRAERRERIAVQMMAALCSPQHTFISWEDQAHDAVEMAEALMAKLDEAALADTPDAQLADPLHELHDLQETKDAAVNRSVAKSILIWQRDRRIADLRQQLDAAQASLTRERLDAEERCRELERLREGHARLGRLVEARGHELELMEGEIDTLRQQLDAAQREASDEFIERQVLQHEASDDYVELERLRAFVKLARGITPRNSYAGVEMLRAALDELDAGTTQSAPAAEPLDAEGGA